MKHEGEAAVLVVDDTPDHLDLMGVQLRKAGYHVLTAHDGLEALAIAHREHPLLVISDVMMPRVDGIELCRRLRADTELQTTPILLVSGMRVDDASAVEGLEAGADDYLEAPYDAMRLIAKVTRLTERARFEEALRESEERYALAARGASDGLWDWDLRSNEIYFSTRWKTMLGFVDGEITDRAEEWFERVHADDLKNLKAEIEAHIEGLTSHLETEHRVLHKDGSYRWMLSRGMVVRDAEGKAYRMAGSQTDITERKRAEEQLLHDAFHDALTGLPNRALFMDRLGQAVERARRHGEYSFSVIFLDLDRFKLVNDSLGHLIGDQLLIEVGRRLQGCMRAGDTVARMGGDEFTILLEDVSETEIAANMAERIQQQVVRAANLSGQEVFITASIGIALSAIGYQRPEDILRDANIAMHRAKFLGKARHQVFDTTMHSRAGELLRLETDLRRTVADEEYKICYQPIVSLESGQMVGLEALVRWQHPERGLVYPDEFIPVAEETGLIIALDRWVLRQACQQMRSLSERFPAQLPLTLSVNLSAKQFSHMDLIEQVRQILQETGLDARSLKLEITENVLLLSTDAVNQMLAQLRALGIELYLDDFGTGYSSLSYLQRFPIDALKIDRSFVSRIGAGGENAEIARAIVMLAHSLEMKVIAEGVETGEQLEALKKLGCEYGQGNLFSKPVDISEVEKTLAISSHILPGFHSSSFQPEDEALRH
jgi:diguanylate cyclase (GGDEF)-like protein/PAS domain S-box-containing protein